jgi:hypothetical protein
VTILSILKYLVYLLIDGSVRHLDYAEFEIYSVREYSAGSVNLDHIRNEECKEHLYRLGVVCVCCFSLLR